MNVVILATVTVGVVSFYRLQDQKTNRVIRMSSFVSVAVFALCIRVIVYNRPEFDLPGAYKIIPIIAVFGGLVSYFLPLKRNGA